MHCETFMRIRQLFIKSIISIGYLCSPKSVIISIIIYMFVKDHPPPHCHVKYNEFKAIVNILWFQ